jgi:hypothetical protein
MRSVGLLGIQPYWRPAEYDHSSADSVFHVHCIHPLAFSYVMIFYRANAVISTALKVLA